LLLVADLALILQEHVDGADLRDAATAHDRGESLSQAGRWLAALHACPPLPGLKVMSVDRELGKAERWAEEIAPHVARATVGRLRRTRDALRMLSTDVHAYAPAMIHKDFYYAHVRWNGTRLSILDFDQLSIGDPAFDVGHFLAHLERHAHRTTGRFDALGGLGTDFLRCYLASSPVDVRSRLRFYRAYTFLKLAATEARRKHGAWQRATRALAERGCREMHAETRRDGATRRDGTLRCVAGADVVAHRTRHREDATRG
jgi:aminoglycoside phosphotransferase (APT) family kinase protein